jgi:hypothetical protein
VGQLVAQEYVACAGAASLGAPPPFVGNATQHDSPAPHVVPPQPPALASVDVECAVVPVEVDADPEFPGLLLFDELPHAEAAESAIPRQQNEMM